ncbi:MAG TPA: S8 family peptidase [Aldersonia sp.]
MDPAPDGIDAEFAWIFPGGDGAGQRFIDLERGWTLNHEELNDHGATLLHGTLRDLSRGHGTSVLGEICAVDNTIGCVGIAPHVASVAVVSWHASTRPDAIIAAIDNLTFGDLLLLEAQVSLDPTDYPNMLGPIEVYDAEFDAIRLATALGIIVVEAGGNGTNNGSAPALDMDAYLNPAGRAILNRDPANPDFRDSGAIIVSAASSLAPHTRLAYGPHGRRIDCYAWGQNIDTCSSDDAGATNLYTTNFGGTSGASPIVSGAALLVQGLAEASLGFRFGPRQMRSILSDPATGTTPDAAEPTAIGVMPNLRAIIESDALGLAPDVYLRDFVGDSGEPHSGAISASPDVILRSTAVPNPHVAFGAGSGTENSVTLSTAVEDGQDNFIYVRILNQGGAAAANVEAQVHWSEVATLVTPDLWHLIGSVTVPNVPIGEVLTVSDALIWPAAAVPAPGHYCLVALIGNLRDPAPAPADFLDWDNFRTFIRANNNVTWRNFNVVDNEPDPRADPEGFVALPFLFPGAPDKARRFALELVAKLPPGSRVMLEVPAGWTHLTGERHTQGEANKKRKTCVFPLPHFGTYRLVDSIIPARARIRLRLLVHIPKKYRKTAFQILVRQIFEREEVGRVTWRLERSLHARSNESQ